MITKDSDPNCTNTRLTYTIVLYSPLGRPAATVTVGQDVNERERDRERDRERERERERDVDVLTLRLADS